jgi:hypothetical protein
MEPEEAIAEACQRGAARRLFARTVRPRPGHYDVGYLKEIGNRLFFRVMGSAETLAGC